MPRKISQANKKRFANIAEMMCCTCGGMPVQIHHIIGHGMSGMGMKASDEKTIPLCVQCHDQLHRHGHKTFEERYGRSQLTMLEETDAILEVLEQIS